MSLMCKFMLCYFVLIVGNNIFVAKSLEVKVNRIADKAMPSIKKVLEQIGFEPMMVPPISEDLSVATINLTDGVINEATTFVRKKDITVSLVPSIFPTLRINASLYFRELLAKFNYSLEAFVYSDSGTLNATISNITAHVTLDLRILALKLVNPNFKIDNIDNISVTMTSDSYINWLQNVIADTAIPFFKGHISDIAENTVNQLVKQSVKIFNKNKFKFAFRAIKTRIGNLLGLNKK